MSASMFSARENGLDVEIALQLAGQHPGLGGCCLRHRVERLAQHRQRAHQADHRLLGRADARDRARDVVLEQPLALGRERGNRLLPVEVAHRQPEVELLLRVVSWPSMPSSVAESSASESGSGFEFLDDQLAAGGRAEFGEQVLHALGEGLQRQRHALAALRVVEAQLDRRVELAQDFLRAGRKRVDAAFGEVQPRGWSETRKLAAIRIRTRAATPPAE